MGVEQASSQCSRCHAPTSAPQELIHVFAVSDSLTSTPVSVCHDCLEGYLVPVRRPTNQLWEFGLVLGNGSKSKHCLRFVDDLCEWVTIEPDAYDQYIQHFNVTEEEGDNAIHDDAENLVPLEDFTPLDINDGFLLDGFPEVDFPVQMETENLLLDASELMLAEPFPEEKTVLSIFRPSISVSPVQRSGPLQHDDHYHADSSPPRKKSKSAMSPRYNQRLWTPEEDQILIKAVASMPREDFRWSVVAKKVPGRTGKQCRERYLNHLTPSLRQGGWTLQEDALIFRMHATEGSKWSMIVKFLRGRSDNGIKNRFHHLNRRLEREVQGVPVPPDLQPTFLRLKGKMTLHSTPPWMLKYVVLRSKVSNEENMRSHAMREAVNKACNRCGLLVPSRQAGWRVCKKLGWCEHCLGLSPCISGDLLRACREK
eukprot:Nitzschia sp. Nitz4//scaffold182_size44100//12721//14151//NITZ4_007249-RA/size44100-augustus-gene-0.21-mRNA-1//-1//CDS//3329539550//1140//frame0